MKCSFVNLIDKIKTAPHFRGLKSMCMFLEFGEKFQSLIAFVSPGKNLEKVHKLEVSLHGCISSHDPKIFFDINGPIHSHSSSNANQTRWTYGTFSLLHAEGI